MDRLYLIVRADLPPGDQATQAAHALSAFAVAYPELHKTWHTTDQNLIFLAIPDELRLRVLYESAIAAGVEHASFEEPDIGGELTAIALAGTAKKLVSSLPLALREPRRAA